MIEVNHITKRYGNKKALDDITFSVNKGEILGFLGPNGAGKSTTMNIITGYLSSNDGEVLIDSYDILKSPIKAKSKIGYLPEMPPLYADMTVKDYLGFVFDLKKIKESKQEHINEICELVRIDHVYERIIKNLSKGYKQRVGLAQALLGYPPVIILDEPTVGLDPKQIIEMRDLIKSLKDKHTVILSSHILSEIQAVCDRVLVINQGKIIADDTPENLSKNMGTENKFIAKIKGDEDAIYNALIEIKEIIGITKNGEEEENVFEFEITTSGDIDVRPFIFREMSKDNMQILELLSAKMNLEDIFLTLTGQDDTLKEEQENNELECCYEDNEELSGEISEFEKYMIKEEPFEDKEDFENNQELDKKIPDAGEDVIKEKPFEDEEDFENNQELDEKIFDVGEDVIKEEPVPDAENFKNKEELGKEISDIEKYISSDDFFEDEAESKNQEDEGENE